MSSSLISSIFPSLIFNDFTLSSDNNSGFSDKFGLKDSIYSICGYTVKIQDYLFEGIKVKFNLSGNHTKEIEVQNAKIKILVLTNDNSKEVHNLDIGTDILINNLEIEFFKEDTSLFNLNSSNAQIKLISETNIKLILPSCEIICQGNRIIEPSDLQILLDKQDSSFSFTSNDGHLRLPIETSQFLFPLFYSIISNLRSTSFSFNKVELFINNDTKAIITDFSYKIESDGEFILTFLNCEFYLSSYKFNLQNFKLDNKSITIQNIDMNDANCSIQSHSQIDEPIIHGEINKQDSSIKIDVMPIECNFSLFRFHNFAKLVLKNSFWHFLTHLKNWKNFAIEFKDIFLNIKIDEKYTIHINFNLIYTNQIDLILISSTRLSYHFNNGCPITKGQFFQYSQKQVINNETNEPTSSTEITLSQLVYNFSIDEVFPFAKLIKKMANIIIDIFFKGEVKITVSDIQILIGQTIKGSNEHSQFIDILLSTSPIQINTTREGFVFNVPVTFSMKYFNALTKFWDSIIEPLNVQFIIKFNKFKRHFTALVENEISINLTSRFLSSLINILKDPIVERTPDYFISNYTNSTINISIQESKTHMTILPMSSQPLNSDTFFINLDGNDIKFSMSAITSRTFIRSHLFIDVELKEGTKNIYFMNLYSIENKLGTDLRVVYKDKHSFTTLMNINNKQRRGFTKPSNFKVQFGIVPLNNGGNSQGGSSQGGFFSKKEQYQAVMPKKYKSIPYTIRGIDSDRDADCIIFLKKYKEDKTKVMLILPRYEIENRLPFEVTFNFKHMKASSTVKVESLKKKSVLMPYDVNQQFEITAKINDREESKPTVISLKLEPLKSQEYDLSFEKCHIPLSVSIGDAIPTVRFVLKCPTTVFNRSSSSFNVNRIILQKEKSYQLPKFESEGFPALFLTDQGEPEIEVPVTSYSETIHFLAPPFLEQSDVIMLKNRANEKLFTPVKVHVKRDLVKGNLIYLYDFIHVKNSTKRPINFILEQDSNKIRLKFEPGVTSPILFTDEEKSFRIEIDGYKESSKIFLSYPTDTVLRFFSNEKLNRRKKENELHIRMVITENKEGQNEVELTDATFESAPYLIVNDTDHILYAQQTNAWLPLRVSPRSSTVFAFDYPFQKPFAVLTIEGKSVMCHFSEHFNKTKFSFRISNDFLNLSVKTNKHNQRIICVSDHDDEPVYDHFISILIESLRVTLIKFDQKPLSTILAQNLKFIGKSEGGIFSITNSVESIQIEDETDNLSQGIILKGSKNNHKSNFLSISAISSSTSKKLNLAQLIGLSIEINPIDIQINSETFACFRKFLIDSNLTNLHFLRNIFKHKLINASIFVISPISVNLFIRKNIGEMQLNNMHLYHILPIQTPSLVNFTLPSILINKISCTFVSISDFVNKIYKKLLINFFSYTTGLQTFKQTASYPYSFFEGVTLSISELNSKSNIEDLLGEFDKIDDILDDEFQSFSSQCQQENDKRIATIEIGNYKNLNETKGGKANNNNNTSNINNNSNININEYLSKDSSNNSNSNLSSSQNILGNSNSPILSIFNSQTTNIPSRDDFHFIKDENQISNIYNSKYLKRIENKKVFQLNRIEPIDLIAYNNAITISKKKKTPLFFQPLRDKNNYLLVFDECIVTVDSEQIKIDILFSSILEFSNEKTVVKVTIKPEKPKLPPKVVELEFTNVFDAETAMYEMISRLMMPDK